MTPNEELLEEYLRISRAGYEMIYELTSKRRESVDYLEIMHLSQALFRLPYSLKYHADFQIEMMNASLDTLVNKYPNYKYLQDAFVEATQIYMIKQKPRKKRVTSKSRKNQ